MAWCRPGDKVFSKAMMTHICVTRPQRAKPKLICDKYHCNLNLVIRSANPVIDRTFSPAYTFVAWYCISYHIVGLITIPLPTWNSIPVYVSVCHNNDIVELIIDQVLSFQDNAHIYRIFLHWYVMPKIARAIMCIYTHHMQYPQEVASLRTMKPDETFDMHIQHLHPSTTSAK